MRNIFITRRQHDLTEFKPQTIKDDLGREWPISSPVSTNIEITDSLDMYHEYMKNHDEVGLDTENSGLNQYYAVPLLEQYAFPGISFIIDQTSVNEDYLSPYTDKLFIGHNIQYDYRIIKYNKGIELLNLEDIMINEQIINRGSGRLNNLKDTYERRTGKTLPEDKSVRKDFMRMTEKSVFQNKHIIYAGFDPQTGLEIRPIQHEILERYKLTFRAKSIAMPLISILGDMNLEGGTLNKEKWKQNIEENKKEKFRLELELDAIVKEFSKTNIKLRGGIWSSASRTRKKEEGEQLGMFGTSITIGNECTKNVSYTSPQQMPKLFKILNEPLPMKESKENRNWGEAPTMKVSFDEPTLEQYKITNPNSRMIPFINLLLQHKEVVKELNSFGEIFLREYVKDGKSGKKSKRGYYQPKTDKIHTIYKQEFQKNGRLASGGDKKAKGELGVGFFNSQQWPKKNKFRNCFTLTQKEIDEGWLMSTDDLGSAELVILADKSKDPNLIKYHKADLHSYLATHSYNKTIDYILNTMDEQRAYDELYNLLKVNRIQKAYKKLIGKDKSGNDLFISFTTEEEDSITKQRVEDVFNNKVLTIDKHLFPDIREPYKNCTYGVTYGAGPDKIAKTLNIAQFYAKLVMEGINIAIPQAMSYLNRMARFGVQNGYIEFNDRTHSRYWFKSWLDAQQYGKKLTSSERGEIERFCKNVTMSGTQADMIKEGMVEIDKFVKANNLDFKWLLQVHDEIVYKHKDKELRPIIENILTTTCNKYLSIVNMEVSGYTGISWNKN